MLRKNIFSGNYSYNSYINFGLDYRRLWEHLSDTSAEWQIAELEFTDLSITQNNLNYLLAGLKRNTTLTSLIFTNCKIEGVEDNNASLKTQIMNLTNLNEQFMKCLHFYPTSTDNIPRSPIVIPKHTHISIINRNHTITDVVINGDSYSSFGIEINRSMRYQRSMDSNWNMKSSRNDFISRPALNECYALYEDNKDNKPLAHYYLELACLYFKSIYSHKHMNKIIEMHAGYMLLLSSLKKELGMPSSPDVPAQSSRNMMSLHVELVGLTDGHEKSIHASKALEYFVKIEGKKGKDWVAMHKLSVNLKDFNFDQPIFSWLYHMYAHKNEIRADDNLLPLTLKHIVPQLQKNSVKIERQAFIEMMELSIKLLKAGYLPPCGFKTMLFKPSNKTNIEAIICELKKEFGSGKSVDERRASDISRLFSINHYKSKIPTLQVGEPIENITHETYEKYGYGNVPWINRLK